MIKDAAMESRPTSSGSYGWQVSENTAWLELMFTGAVMCSSTQPLPDAGELQREAQPVCDQP